MKTFFSAAGLYICHVTFHTMKTKQSSKPLRITLPSGQVYNFNIAAGKPESEVQYISEQMKQWLMKTFERSQKS